MHKNLIIKKALEITPYENLYELANASSQDTTSPLPLENVARQKQVDDKPIQQEETLSRDAKLLACHILASPDTPYAQHGVQLNFSMRRLATVRDELVSKEMVKEIKSGRCIYLAPTEKLYLYQGLISPYKRDISVEHSFSILLTSKCVEKAPLVRKIVIEANIDNSNRTVDLVSYLKNGDRYAYEITLSSSNVSSLAARLKGKGFAKIIFVCRDHHIRKSVQAILGNAGFELEFNSTIECILLSELLRKKKIIESREAK